MGLYCLLLQARIPTDAVSAEGLTAEKLSRYAVVVVQNATALTRTQEDTLRRWVQDGGVLIATASTSVQDQWGRPQTDYRLADIFGVKYVRTAQAGDGATFGDDIPVSYPRGFAFDVVEPAGGTVVARWKTGEPAVVRNIFGKGSTLFLSARDLGLCYQGIPRKGITERFPVHKRFLPGVREFLTKSAQDVLQSAGRPTPFRVMNCPDEVETVIRLQGDGRPIRRVLHLLNYGFNEPVSGVRFEIPALPQGASVFYPVDGKKVEFVTDGAMTRFTVRDFDVHEMVVIEEN
jgi:hypothetical protein